MDLLHLLQIRPREFDGMVQVDKDHANSEPLDSEGFINNVSLLEALTIVTIRFGRH